MQQVSVCLLRLPNGKYVFQRRGKDAPISPGKLGLFGGHIEAGEQPLVALIRELQEETSLDVNTLKPVKIHEDIIDSSPYENRRLYFFLTDIANHDFRVYEGEGAEVYSLEEAAQRTDLAESTELILKKLKDK